MWRRMCRSMAILAQTRISSGSSGRSRHRPRSRVTGAEELIGSLIHELRSGEQVSPEFEPVLIAAPPSPTRKWPPRPSLAIVRRVQAGADRYTLVAPSSTAASALTALHPEISRIDP